MAEPPARPRVVSWCAWLIMIGGAFLVLMAYEHVAQLGSLESQEAAGRMVNDPPLDELGLAVDDVQQIERVFSLLTGAAAAAAAILGFEVLRRSRTSRRVLTFLAPVLLLAGLVVGGMLTFVVVGSIVMLWSPQARVWFGDTPPARAPEPPAPDPTQPAAQDPTGHPARRETQDGAVAVLAPPVPPISWPGLESPTGSPRPRSVASACVITWVTCAMVAVGAIASAILVLAAPDELIDQLREQNPQLEEQGIGDGFVIGVLVVTVAGLVLWCVAAAVLAYLTLAAPPLGLDHAPRVRSPRRRPVPGVAGHREPRRARSRWPASSPPASCSTGPSRRPGSRPSADGGPQPLSVSPPSVWSTVTEPPSTTWPLISSLASGSPIACCTSRRSGRAP